MQSEMLEKARGYEREAAAEIPLEERPGFHLSAVTGWMNDPNGFSEYGGEYHLFYQYYPYAPRWDSMHWGHAKSADFVKWEYIPAALAPDKNYDSLGVFSGSALADGEKHILVYTGVSEEALENGKKQIRQNQCLAVGDGVNYEKYEKNPIIVSEMIPVGNVCEDFRDPKIWKEDGVYYAVVGSRSDDGSGQIAMFRSKNLREWEFDCILDKCENRYGKMWECPDFFPLGEKRILVVSPQDMRAEGLEFHNGNNAIFLTGTYDKERKTFCRENVQAADYGLDFYAPQTMETKDGRRIMVAWMKSWDADIRTGKGKWSGMMTFPRELSVKNGRVYQNPVRELQRYYANYTVREIVLSEESSSLEGIEGRMVDLVIETKKGSSGKMEVCVAKNEKYSTRIVYDFDEEVLSFDRTYSGLYRDVVCKRDMVVRNRDGEVKIRILLDKYSVEIFANDGESAMTSVITTPMQAREITFRAEGEICAQISKYDIVI